MKSLLLVIGALAVASGAPHEGPCPTELKPVENFDVNAYQGVWYEIQKFPTEAERGGQCGQAEYKAEGDIVKVKNSHVLNGTQAVIEGTAKFADDANKAAKLIVTFKFGEVARESPLNVIATDYKNYGIAYTCKYDDKKKSHEDNVWVVSRTKKLEGDAKTAVDNFLKAHSKEIDTSRFIVTDFSEEACKFTSTSTINVDPYNKDKKQ